jgi:hypothetical protein
MPLGPSGGALLILRALALTQGTPGALQRSDTPFGGALPILGQLLAR